MKIICCKCKKEYNLENNIFEYDKANRPILICPHCGFKHIINFMPFEKEIKVKKIKKLNLGTTYYVNLGASRIATAYRVDVSLSDDADVGKISGTPWNLADLKFRASKLVSGEDTAPYKVVFKPDGLKMYMLGYATRDVYQYTLSTAWNVTTAVYNNVHKDLSTEDIEPSGIFFKSNGMKMYMCGGNEDKIFQYSLSTAWDLSTLSYDTGEDFTLPAAAESPSDLYFKADGTKMYVITAWTDKVSQYNLGTAWDVSSAVYNCEKLVSGQSTGPQSVSFKPDGTKMYVLDYGDHCIYQYGLSTAWLVSSATYDSVYKNTINEEEYPRGIWFKEDGKKLYMTGSDTDTVHQYVLLGPWAKADDFILATRIYTSKGPVTRSYKLRWRKTGGTFVDVGATGEITYDATTVLVNDDPLLDAERICGEQSGYTFQGGKESEGDNISPDSFNYTLPDEYYTEFQWALSCDDAEPGAEYEFELWDVTEGTSIGTCLATITISPKRNVTGEANITSNLISVLQISEGGGKNVSGKASITTITAVILDRGKIEGATAKASLTSSIISTLTGLINRTAKSDITSSVISILSKGAIKDAIGESSIITFLSAILSRGKIENISAKVSIISNIVLILSRGKIEDVIGKASISSNIDSILSRGKIENVIGKSNIISSFISIVKGIYAAQGKASITSIITSILSRGKVESVSSKSNMDTSVITILSRGKVEDVSAKTSLISNIIISLSRGKIENAIGKSSLNSIFTAILSRGKVENVTGKSNIYSEFISILSRGKVEDINGKSNINTSIIMALSRGKIESVSGKVDVSSLTNIVLSRGKIKTISGESSIITIIDSILSRGKIENVDGILNITSSMIAILQKEGAKNTSGKSQSDTNIDVLLNRIISINGKAILETLCNIIITKGEIINVNGKAYIYTSIGSKLSRYKNINGKADIDSLINIDLKRILNVNGKSIFDTLIEIEISQQFAYSQATLGILTNKSIFDIIETDSILSIKSNESKLKIER